MHVPRETTWKNLVECPECQRKEGLAVLGVYFLRAGFVSFRLIFESWSNFKCGKKPRITVATARQRVARRKCFQVHARYVTARTRILIRAAL